MTLPYPLITDLAKEVRPLAPGILSRTPFTDDRFKSLRLCPGRGGNARLAVPEPLEAMLGAGALS